VYVSRGPEKALEFLTGYLIEYALSVDNIFVFVLIFTTFGVPAALQRRVLFWGVLGALAMRAAMIAAGAALLAQFHWVLYAFGAFLAVTGMRMLVRRVPPAGTGPGLLGRVLRRALPVAEGYEGERFFVRRDGRLWATPLFLVLMTVEAADAVFAVDSIPAIFGITRDPFVVYTSNVFAVLGLRSLYFLVSGMVGRIRFLHAGLGLVLCFVGSKMLLAEWIEIPPMMSLGAVLAILGTAVGGSLLLPPPAGGVARDGTEERAGRPALGVEGPF
jgi:tellurite resistance protein TerC